MEKSKPGHNDTPIIPGSSWRVHDMNRPHPVVVNPGTESSQTTAGKPPSDAIILFQGKSLDGWIHRDGSPARWKVEKNYMEVVPKTGNIKTEKEFGDCQLHIEWASPEKIEGESQGRGNSGIFLLERYEIQVLDSFENPTYADGSNGSIYGQYPPLVNVCRAPGQWQTYDIVWIGPRFEGSQLIRPAVITIFQNGLLIHHCRKLIGPTTHCAVLPYEPHPLNGSLMLQDHNNPVRFRNIWYRPLEKDDILG
ncbi:MAG: DUF1080 domain-containing protein [Candidatus Ratteibacteria bacterium]